MKFSEFNARYQTIDYTYIWARLELRFKKRIEKKGGESRKKARVLGIHDNEKHNDPDNRTYIWVMRRWNGVSLTYSVHLLRFSNSNVLLIGVIMNKLQGLRDCALGADVGTLSISTVSQQRFINA